MEQKDIWRVSDLIKYLSKLDPDTVVLYYIPELGHFGLTKKDIRTGYCWFAPTEYKHTLQMQFCKEVITVDDHAHLGVMIG